ncbi:MAG: hypothetical protein OXG68_02400 [Chloroflexi bacterium]|nr:hypothetical protein [Chloroflexota bacterium]
MAEAHDFRVVNVSGFKLHGDHILAAFVVGIAALKWSKARADEFADTLRERHPDLIAYEYQYERIPDESEMLRPTIVERIKFAWQREIRGPERRADVNKAFAARRQAVLSL